MPKDKNKINIGLIGYGYWGPNYARLLEKLPQVNFLAIADLTPKLLKEAKLKHNIQTFRDYKQILQNPLTDAVLIITPTSTHFPIARDALNFSKHVFVEKPFTKTSAEAEKLIELANKNKLTLMVGHTFLYNDYFKKVDQLVKKGKIGALRFITATRINLGPIRKDVNVKWDLAPHDISMIIQLVGKMPTEVLATGGAYLTSQSDVAFITLKFPDNIIANITVSWLAPVKSRQLTLVGSKKMIVFDDVNLTNKVFIYNKGVTLPRGASYGDFSRFGIYTQETETPEVIAREPLLNKLEHFLECIVKNKTPLSDGQNGLDVIKILEACDKSFKLGKYIKLK